MSRARILRIVTTLVLCIAAGITGAGPANAQCGFNSVGDFVCPGGKFEPPPNPFPPAPPAKAQPVPPKPVPTPMPSPGYEYALGDCFFAALDGSGGTFNEAACRQTLACLAGQGFTAHFSCDFSSGSGAGGLASAAGIAACDDLPYRGLYYGNLIHSDTVADIRVSCGRPLYQPFTAERSGGISDIQWYLRYNKGCHGTAGCYSGGDGGQIQVSLYEAGSNGMPTGNALGQSAINGGRNSIFDWGSSWGDFPIWDLNRAVSVEAGKRYVMVLENHSCSGWIATNGMLSDWVWADERSGRAGPYYSNDRSIYQGSKLHYDHMSLFALKYTDGMSIGPSVIWASGSSMEMISNDAMARERFTVTDTTRLVDGVDIWAWRTTGNEGNMTVVLRNSAGSVIARGVVPATAFAVSKNHTEGAPARPWAHATFDSPVTLNRGQSYTVELSATGCCYRTIPGVEASDLGTREAWTSGVAEFSTNGGSSWRCGKTKDSPSGHCGLDLPLGFSVAANEIGGEMVSCRAAGN